MRNESTMSQIQVMCGGKLMWAASNFISRTGCRSSNHLERAWWRRQWIFPLLSSAAFLAGQRPCDAACQKVSYGASGSMATTSDKKRIWKWGWRSSRIYAYSVFNTYSYDSSDYISRFWTRLIHQADQHPKRKSSRGSRTKFTRRFFKRSSAASDIALRMEMLISVWTVSLVCCTPVFWLNHKMQRKQLIFADAVRLALTTHVQSA